MAKNNLTEEIKVQDDKAADRDRRGSLGDFVLVTKMFLTQAMEVLRNSIKACRELSVLTSPPVPRAYLPPSFCAGVR